MAEVTAVLVKELREKTGAGMMDCKRALDDSAGDIEAAVDWLRKKGLSAAAKKAGRVAAEGLIGVATRGPVGAVVEVNSETDFVARNQAFQSFVRSVSELALDGDGELESLKEADFPGTGRTVEQELTHLISTIGENLVLRRVKRLSTKEGAVFSYVHNALGPTSSPGSASSWRCISRRRTRSISISAQCRRPRSTANATCFENRRAPPANPTR
jgi:elongation factor Ts